MSAVYSGERTILYNGASKNKNYQNLQKRSPERRGSRSLASVSVHADNGNTSQLEVQRRKPRRVIRTSSWSFTKAAFGIVVIAIIAACKSLIHSWNSKGLGDRLHNISYAGNIRKSLNFDCIGRCRPLKF